MLPHRSDRSVSQGKAFSRVTEHATDFLALFVRSGKANSGKGHDSGKSAQGKGDARYFASSEADFPAPAWRCGAAAVFIPGARQYAGRCARGPGAAARLGASEAAAARRSV